MVNRLFEFIFGVLTTYFLCDNDIRTFVTALIQTIKNCLPIILGGVKILIYLSLLYCFWRVFKFLFYPYIRIKNHGSLGFIKQYEGMTHKDIIRECLHSKEIGKIPPVFPNGWFQVIKSNDIRPGEVKKLIVLGKNLTIYRTKISKEVHIVDSYCPHLGADLSNGGQVHGDCITCPFHGWKFNSVDGKVSEIPYTAKPEKLSFVKLNKWHCVEKWNWVYMWYHIDEIPPFWNLPEIKKFPDLTLSAVSQHIVDCHIEDIPENAADSAHLSYLHKPAMSNDLQVSSKYDDLIAHEINCQWYPCKTKGEEHLADVHITDTPFLTLFKKRINFFTLRFFIKQIGPGVVHIRVQACGFEFLVIQTVTPLKPLQQRLRQDFYVPHWWLLPLAKPFILMEIIQIERDVAIWTNKTYLSAPKLTREEKVISDHRRWYRNFYSENSLRLNSNGGLESPSACKRKNDLEF